MIIVNKVLVGAIVVIVILVAAFSFFAFAKVDTTLNVNSAFYTSNIIDKQPVNGKYLMMNVSVKNNGQGTLTVSNDQFTPMVNGKPVEKYSVFTGDGTDLQRQVTVASGESKDLWVIFDIGDQKPDSIEYHGPLAWASTYKTSTSINSITPGVPFNGMNQTAKTNMGMNGTVMGISVNMKMNGTDNEFFEKTDDINIIKLTKKVSSTTNSNINGQNNTQNENTEETEMINLNTGLLTNGTSYSTLLPKNLTKTGDTTNIDNSTYTIVGSEKIEILGHKIDCWKVESTYEREGSKLKATMFYDKTTRMILKMVADKQNMPVSGYNFEVTAEAELTSTNMPLIGIA